MMITKQLQYVLTLALTLFPIGGMRLTWEKVMEELVLYQNTDKKIEGFSEDI